MKKIKELPLWIKIVVPIILVIIIGVLCLVLFKQDNEKEKEVLKKKASEITTKEECEKEKFYWWSKTETCNTEPAKLEIVDVNSKSRPIAVMINNHNQARPYHSGINEANIVYEMIVEGGITRMMAIFKDKNTARIGSVRSSRHYFLDYALENDAIYVHFGWSPQAESDISLLGVNNVNGLYDSGFWRDNELPIDYEHRALTSIENIKNVMSFRGYRTEYNSSDVLEEQLLNYSIDEINISNTEDSIVANNISVPYSSYMTSSYTYDPVNKYYLRFANGVAHNDYVTKEQYHFKNIIVINVRNYTIDNYGRQGLDNIGSGNGYYITDGYARPITWEKSSRNSKTVYKYLDGTEITVNDGNTFIQIQPTGKTTTITE